MLEVALICLATGVLTGFLSGLFGVGGGLVLVPVLVALFAVQQFDPAIHMPLALGTSLCTIVVNGMSSTLAHHRRGAVDWNIFSRLAPSLVIGALIGAQLASAVPSATMKVAFGIGELLVAVRLLTAGKPKPGRGLPSSLGMSAAGAVIGTISAMAGIGGATLSVPYMTWCNVVMQRAVATAAACGLPIAVAGAIGYVVSGWSVSDLPAWTTGYVYWPAAVAVMLAGVVMAPVGARLAHRWPPEKLKLGFALLLTVLGLKMLLF